MTLKSIVLINKPCYCLARIHNQLCASASDWCCNLFAAVWGELSAVSSVNIPPALLWSLMFIWQTFWKVFVQFFHSIKKTGNIKLKMLKHGSLDAFKSPAEDGCLTVPFLWRFLDQGFLKWLSSLLLTPRFSAWFRSAYQESNDRNISVLNVLVALLPYFKGLRLQSSRAAVLQLLYVSQF